MKETTYRFCTLFDSYYILKGLALYKSLEYTCSDFCLYIMAFDEESYNKLQTLRLEKAVICKLEDFETPELLSVKQTRNKAEYCWTCGPAVIEFFMDKYELPDCTYLDADLMFINSPQIIFNEFNDKTSIGITEHFHNDTLGGRYCVQFMYFRNNIDGRRALKWWREKCVEWCYARHEDGKYGDQKYLDEFPVLFNNVHVIKNRGAGIAPWNVNFYSFPKKSDLLLYNNREYDVVFFHFHGIKIDRLEKTLVLKTVTYDVSDKVKELFLYPYLKIISSVYLDFFNVEICLSIIEGRKTWERFYSFIKKIFRKSKMFQVLYYKILKVRYNGYESKKVI